MRLLQQAYDFGMILKPGMCLYADPFVSTSGRKMPRTPSSKEEHMDRTAITTLGSNLLKALPSDDPSSSRAPTNNKQPEQKAAAPDREGFEDWPVLVSLIIAGVLALGLLGVAVAHTLD